MFYTIYKITNLVNGKEYIGKHQTNDVNDDYLGSGKNLRRAIEKHGRSNFRKEILFIYETEEEMNAKEAELVTEEYISRKDTYNICVGGKGGWSYINANGLSLTEKHAKAANQNRLKGVERYLELVKDEEWNKVFREKIRSSHPSKREGYVNPFEGKVHSDETKQKWRGHKRQCGQSNSQYGSCWITDGTISRKIKKTDPIPDGWRIGRVIRG